MRCSGVIADRKRVAAATGALVVQALLVAALVFGLNIDVPAKLASAMRVFEVTPPPPPAPRPQPKARAVRAQGRAAPPHARAVATPVVAPVPVIVLPPPPPPLVVAPVANIGVEAQQGAGLAGPGTGAGGQGDGTGSGGAGNGNGGGEEIPLRRIRGRIRDSDYPPGALAAGVSGTVLVRFHVGIDGRVHDCKVTKTSGSPDLDEVTCRLILERFRYEPTRDASGRKVPDTVEGEHRWETGLRRDGDPG